jgi:hypothetical protein
LVPVALRDAELAVRLLEPLGPNVAENLLRARATLAQRYGAAGRIDDAVSVAQAVVASRHKARQATPTARADYAAALLNLALRYAEGERWHDAAAVAEDGLAEYQAVRRHLPWPRWAEPAELALFLMRMPDWVVPVATAVATAREAVDLLAAYGRHDDRYAEDHLLALNRLADLLAEDGQPVAAVDASRSVVARWRDLVAFQPTAVADLARALRTHSRRCLAAARAAEAEDPEGHWAEGIQAGSEALAVSQTIADPELNAAETGTSSLHLSQLYAGPDEPYQSLRLAVLAERSFRRLAVERPDVYLVHLAAALVNRSRRHHELGNGLLARRDAEEATAQYRAVVTNDPTQRSALLTALRNQIECTPPEETATRRALLVELVEAHEAQARDGSPPPAEERAAALRMLAATLDRGGRAERAEAARLRRRADELLRDVPPPDPPESTSDPGDVSSD